MWVVDRLAEEVLLEPLETGATLTESQEAIDQRTSRSLIKLIDDLQAAEQNCCSSISSHPSEPTLSYLLCTFITANQSIHQSHSSPPPHTSLVTSPSLHGKHTHDQSDSHTEPTCEAVSLAHTHNGGVHILLQ